jgi:hypothetical protein
MTRFRPCRVCGDFIAHNGGPCKRCQSSMNEDRMVRGEREVLFVSEAHDQSAHELAVERREEAHEATLRVREERGW